jgi:hypothetical protein
MIKIQPKRITDTSNDIEDVPMLCNVCGDVMELESEFDVPWHECHNPDCEVSTDRILHGGLYS